MQYKKYRKYGQYRRFENIGNIGNIGNIDFVRTMGETKQKNQLLGETVTQKPTFGGNHRPKIDFWVKLSPKKRLLGETITQK